MGTSIGVDPNGGGFIPGRTYQFDPPVVATGFPIGGKEVAAAQELSFAKGWCLCFKKEVNAYVFQGSPVDDPRKISNKLRGCYFYVERGRGSIAEIVKE